MLILPLAYKHPLPAEQSSQRRRRGPELLRSGALPSLFLVWSFNHFNLKPNLDRLTLCVDVIL